MKTLQEQQNKKQLLINELVNKAWESDSFKEQLINNPKETIASIIGKDVPSDFDVDFVIEDQTDPSIIYFNIPQKVNLENVELTEEQLLLVAGGSIFYDAGKWCGEKVKEAWDWLTS